MRTLDKVKNQKMIGFVRNFLSVVSNPAILRWYIPWLLSRVTGRSPVLNLRGVKLAGFPNFSAYWGAFKYQPSDNEILYIRQNTKSASIVLDVGANFGVFAILLARSAPNAQIYAFEPNPTTARALEANLHRNGISNVLIVEAAVGREDGSIRFTDSSAPATNRISNDNEGGVVVALRSLDSFCNEKGIQEVSFIKIDIEGAELLALEGAANLFNEKCISYGIIEICPQNLRQFGVSKYDLHKFLFEHGYHLSPLSDSSKSEFDHDFALENFKFHIT